MTRRAIPILGKDGVGGSIPLRGTTLFHTYQWLGRIARNVRRGNYGTFWHEHVKNGAPKSVPFVLAAFMAWPALADQQAQVVIVGDSFAAGPSEPEEGLPLDWQGYLAEAGCETTVVNLAVGSKTLAEIRATQAWQAARFRPAVVVVWDAAPFFDEVYVSDAVAVAVRHWTRLRDALNSQGIAPLVLAYTPSARARTERIGKLRPIVYRDAVRALNDRLAALDGITLVRWPAEVFDGGYLKRAMTAADLFHPADALYRVAAAALVQGMMQEGVCG